jgi:ribosome-binding protein aMBF1 (putative translation factor)
MHSTQNDICLKRDICELCGKETNGIQAIVNEEWLCACIECFKIIDSRKIIRKKQYSYKGYYEYF